MVSVYVPAIKPLAVVDAPETTELLAGAQVTEGVGAVVENVATPVEPLLHATLTELTGVSVGAIGAVSVATNNVEHPALVTVTE